MTITTNTDYKYWPQAVTTITTDHNHKYQPQVLSTRLHGGVIHLYSMILHSERWHSVYLDNPVGNHDNGVLAPGVHGPSGLQVSVVAVRGVELGHTGGHAPCGSDRLSGGVQPSVQSVQTDQCLPAAGRVGIRHTEPGGWYLLQGRSSSDPQGNCRLNVKKLPKLDFFFNWQKLSFFSIFFF